MSLYTDCTVRPTDADDAKTTADNSRKLTSSHFCRMSVFFSSEFFLQKLARKRNNNLPSFVKYNVLQACHLYGSRVVNT